MYCIVTHFYSGQEMITLKTFQLCMHACDGIPQRKTG
jgi:hypothetical protein